MTTFKKKILLASNSPRRKELLTGLGLPFEVRTTPVDETHEGIFPEHVSAYLAEKKARAFEDPGDQALILCADTVVVIGDKILGKPADRQEAVEMLKMQSGATHQVFTSVCLRDDDRLSVKTDVASVTFRVLSEAEIHYYVDTFRPFDKAGAYGIQEWIGMVGVERIEGSFYTIMGLPTHLVYQMLQPYIANE